MKILGWLGSILLAFCGLPSAIYAIKEKNSPIPWILLIPWLLGEVFVLIPVVINIKSPYLIFNYAANVLFVGIICYYKLRSKRDGSKGNHKQNE